MSMKQVTIENVKKRILELERAGCISLNEERELDCLRQLVAVTELCAASISNECTWETTMMQACGEDGPKSVAEKFAELKSQLHAVVAENASLRQRVAELEGQLEVCHSDLCDTEDAMHLWAERAQTAEKRIAELEAAATCKFMPVGVMSQSKFERLDDGSVRFIALWPRPGVAVSRKRPDDGVLVYAKVAGIKLEVEE